MTKDDDENFKKSTKCWNCDTAYVHSDFKVKDHCHITGKYKGSAHRGCNINVKLNHTIPVIFHNLKKIYSNLIMLELRKFSLKINVTPNGLEKYEL